MTGLAYAGPALAEAVTLSPAMLPRVATVDPRSQSYNVEMAEVIGGSFWKRIPAGQGRPERTATG